MTEPRQGGRGTAGNGVGLTVLGLALGCALIASTWLASETFRSVRAQGETIEVKGFAERRIRSDWAVWGGRMTTRAPALDAAYATLSEQQELVLDFLRAQGTDPSRVEVSPVQTQVLFKRDARGVFTNQVEGYALSLEFHYSDADIDLVARLAQESASLIQKGVEFTSRPPEYFYTQLEDLKIELLGDATADARRRAQALAENAGSSIGPLRHARQGVFQITPAHSTEVSDYGRHDTSAKEKAVKAVVTMRFAVTRSD